MTSHEENEGNTGDSCFYLNIFHEWIFGQIPQIGMYFKLDNILVHATVKWEKINSPPAWRSCFDALIVSRLLSLTWQCRPCCTYRELTQAPGPSAKIASPHPLSWQLYLCIPIKDCHCLSVSKQVNVWRDVMFIGNIGNIPVMHVWGHSFCF